MTPGNISLHMVTTGNDLPGYRIARAMGIVRGITVSWGGALDVRDRLTFSLGKQRKSNSLSGRRAKPSPIRRDKTGDHPVTKRHRHRMTRYAHPFRKKPPIANNAPTAIPATPAQVGTALSCVAVSFAEPTCTSVSVCW